jgi:hypothetical protein
MLYTVNTIFDGLHAFHAPISRATAACRTAPTTEIRCHLAPWARLRPFAIELGNSEDSVHLTVLLATCARTLA